MSGGQLEDEYMEVVRRHTKGKHGKHEYKLEDYGISREQVETLFADYVKRYDVEME